jgi:hypothetical protein
MRSTPAPSKVSRPKWPRQYAQLILAAGDDLAREVLWAKVPTEWRDMVQLHISQAETHAEQHVCQRDKFRPAVSPAVPVLAEYHEPVQVRGNALVAAVHLAALRAVIHPPRVSL